MNYVKAKHNTMMMKKWNSLDWISERLETRIVGNRKLCLDIVEIQELLGDVIDDFVEQLEEASS